MPNASSPILRASGIFKGFGNTQALSGADLEIIPGEVHALCGANGAGKSTLSRIISGQMAADSGNMVYREHPVRFASSREAMLAGVSMVMQETSLCPDLTVLENIYLPELGLPGRLSRSSWRKRAQVLLRDLDPQRQVALSDLVSEISIGNRQLIEIAKALALDSEVIIFDEPTASFSPQEAENLFDVMRKLASRGKALVFVSHRLEEIFEIADRVTILRDGRTVAGKLATPSLSAGDLIRHMVGRDLTDIYSGRKVTAYDHGSKGTEPVLEVRGLASYPSVRDISFAVHEGEILGLGGLVGAGRTEAVEAIFGLRSVDAGEIWLNGRRATIRNPAVAIAAGLGLIPEDRRAKGIAPDMSVRENLMLAHLGQHTGWGTGYRSRETELERVLDDLELPIKRVIDIDILKLSGGQQQKVILARWLLLKPSVLILDEPTRGVDIGTRSIIYELLRRIAAEGIAVIVISSDFEEVLGISDRVVVISDGVDVADVPARELDVEKLTMFAAPRSSANATRLVLNELIDRFGGTAAWVELDGGRVYCFDSVQAADGVDAGFNRGSVLHLDQSRISGALEEKKANFVRESNTDLQTLVTPIRTDRKRNLGFVTLTLETTTPPSGASVREVIGRVLSEKGGGSVAAVTLEGGGHER